MSKKSLKHEKQEIKVILVGNIHVGKTSIINKTMGYTFDENLLSTTAASFNTKTIKIDQTEYKVNIWDTMGKEILRAINKLFYLNSKIVLFVYDITSKESFEGLRTNVSDIEEALGDDIIKGLIANKSDLYLEEKVTEEEGRDYAKSIGAKFLMFSAKTDNVSKFDNFLEELLSDYISNHKDFFEDRGDFRLIDKPEKPEYMIITVYRCCNCCCPIHYKIRRGSCCYGHG